MRQIVGVLIMILGVCAGIYAGVVWAFIGGIVDIANAFKAPSLDATMMAWGIAKFMFSGLIGWLTAVSCVWFGAAIGESSGRRSWF